MTKYRGNAASYRVLGELSWGGFGEVYEAEVLEIHDPQKWLAPGPSSGEKVILKRPRLDDSLEHWEARRFLLQVTDSFHAELGAHSRLRNLRCVPDIYDTGVSQEERDGQVLLCPFIIQELIRGQHLDGWCASEFPSANGGFFGVPNVAAFYHLATELCSAVREIHRAGVIHGDLHPRNIIFRDEDRSVALIDFGGSVFRNDFLLRPGREVNAAAPFLAPERYHEGREGRRGDVYSLGANFFFIATGNVPPPANPDKDSTKRHVVNSIDNGLLDENCGLGDIIARCLRHDRKQRPRDADAIQRELDVFVGQPKRAPSVATEALPDIAGKRDELASSGRKLFAGMLEQEASRIVNLLSDFGNDLHEVTGDHDDIVEAMCKYLSLLKPGDRYMARTVPKFFFDRNMGVNGRYLSMNSLLAQRGVTVTRLFLLCEEDRSNSEVEEILVAHLRAEQRTAGTGQEGRGLRSFYRLVAQEERTKQLHAEGWHAGLLLTESSGTFIEPVYDSEDTLGSVRFIYRPDAPERWQHRFEDEVARADALEQWFS